MLGNALMTVRNCTENDALALAFYLYQMTVDITELDSSEECQVLYEALVDRLDLGNHVDAILNALLYKLEKTKQLTLISVDEKYKHPFYTKGKLKTNYREDDSIYENCGRWISNTQRNINLIRVLFSSNKSDFARIVALTFFTKPGSFSDKTVALPNKVVISKDIKKAVDDISSVKFAVDTLKLSKEESQLLQVAFRLQSVK